ncbi:MAG: hypothetical protein AVDCRST_MAG01-01-1864 [uncultured Rubrobacteraceae bacterium]|uniref:Uncharacterized protein n=1 Tax=uncultured Rubrobacteraceae bacterium TaxID=349277 RepID=A0A6J4PHX9_9ACTN|nr:MAG: hypothetical protein AVDCRST_MAG01-01-1864 [uncultured Rubrobacteraceae bacterium]
MLKVISWAKRYSKTVPAGPRREEAHRGDAELLRPCCVSA